MGIYAPIIRNEYVTVHLRLSILPNKTVAKSTPPRNMIRLIPSFSDGCGRAEQIVVDKCSKPRENFSSPPGARGFLINYRSLVAFGSIYFCFVINLAYPASFFYLSQYSIHYICKRQGSLLYRFINLSKISPLYKLVDNYKLISFSK